MARSEEKREGQWVRLLLIGRRPATRGDLTLHLGQPLWLTVVFRGAGHRVEEHQEKHQPVEVGGFHSDSAVLPHGVIQLAQLVAGRGGVRDMDTSLDQTVPLSHSGPAGISAVVLDPQTSGHLVLPP